MIHDQGIQVRCSKAGRSVAAATPESAFSPRRLFWASLLLLHLGPVRSLVAQIAASDLGGWEVGAGLRLLGLAVWSTFFILKIVDVSWLRLNPGWRSRLSAILVVGLLHVGVVERIIDREVVLSSAQFGFILTAAATWQGDEVRRRIGRWWTRSVASPRPRAFRSPLAVGAFVPHERIRRPAWHFLPAFARLRAPPSWA